MTAGMKYVLVAGPRAADAARRSRRPDHGERRDRAIVHDDLDISIRDKPTPYDATQITYSCGERSGGLAGIPAGATSSSFRCGFQARVTGKLVGIALGTLAMTDRGLTLGR